MNETLANYEAKNSIASLSDTSDDIFKLGQTLYESGYFKDIKSGAQAIVKILRGRELGMGPIQSLENVYVVEGRTSLSYPAIGAQIKKSGRYDYRVLTSTNDECEIAFFEQGKEMGRERFDRKDADRAMLLGKDNWKKYPKAMLFARAMSAGARQYTPDVFGGTVYSVEELRDINGAEPQLAIETTAVERNGDIVDTQTVEITESAPPKSKLRQDKERGYTLMHDKYHDILDIPPLNPDWTDEELDGTGSHWKQKIIQYTKDVPAAAVPA